MGWMDRLLQKAQTSAAVTGRDLSQSVITPAMAAGLERDYGESFQYAQLAQQESQFNKSAELKNKEIDAATATANARTQMMGDAYNRQADLAEKQAFKQNIANAVSAVPAIDKYLGISDKVKLANMKYAPYSSTAVDTAGSSYVSGAAAPESAFTYGAGSNYGQAGFEAATSTAEYMAPGSAALDAGMYGGAGEAAFNYAAGSYAPAAFGTSASEAATGWALAGESMAAATVQTGEAAFSAAVSSWGIGTAAGSWGVAAEAAEAWGVAAGAAEGAAAEGSLLSAVSTIGSAIPVVGWVCAAVAVVAAVAFSDDSIICTEMHRRYDMSKRDLCMTNIYRKRFVDDDTYTGYLILFTPFVNKMRLSDKFYKLVSPFTKAFVKEMKHRIGRGEGSLLGTILIDFFTPVCSLLAKANRVKERINGYIVRTWRNRCRNIAGC